MQSFPCVHFSVPQQFLQFHRSVSGLGLLIFNTVSVWQWLKTPKQSTIVVPISVSTQSTDSKQKPMYHTYCQKLCFGLLQLVLECSTGAYSVLMCHLRFWERWEIYLKSFRTPSVKFNILRKSGVIFYT